jgi:DNA-binding MurR/RpiR family transcriptional regulator
MVTERIHKHYYILTAAERKVADFILLAPYKVINMTVNTLSSKAKVAPSAVIRFCKTVGFGGFLELKIALVQESAAFKEDTAMPAFNKGAEVKTTVHKVFETGIKTLRDTESIVDFKKIEKMTVALRKAKRIFIFAVGTSSIVATDFQYRLSQLGFWATAYTDVLFMNVTAVNLTPDDVVLAISHSGRTKAVVDAARHAKKAGATTIAVTSFSDSMLYRESDIAVSVFADEINYPVEAVSARLAHICLLDAVTMALATGIEEFPSRIKARNKILNEIRY